ncbi:MAG: carboxypeptidase regulatory-like domain-containing protein [Gemmatimonadota bacterium]
MRLTVLGCVWLGTALPLAAQVSLTGVVVDARTDLPIEGAALTLLGTDRQLVTTADGAFRFTGLPAGDLILRTRRLGYADRADTLSVGDGETLDLRVPLSVRAIDLAPIVVVARGRERDPARAFRLDGMDRAAIEAVLPRAHTMQDLIRQANVPGLELYELQQPGESASLCIELRRARRDLRNTGCNSVSVYIDGRRAINPTSALVDLSPEVIERWEIVDPIDARVLYGTDGDRGVLAIETRIPVDGDRAAPRVARDLARFRVVIAAVGGAPATVHDGRALTFGTGNGDAQYTERTAWRPGVLVAVQARVAGWLPDLSLGAYAFSGGSEARYGGTGAAGTFTTSLSTQGVDLTLRPLLHRSLLWDLYLEAGASLAREELTLEDPTPPGAGPEVVEILATHLERSWTTLGVAVGMHLERQISPAWSVLAGGRMRLLTGGKADDALEPRDGSAPAPLRLPMADERHARTTVEVGLVRRLGR